jgi:hypothetical protein
MLTLRYSNVTHCSRIMRTSQRKTLMSRPNKTKKPSSSNATALKASKREKSTVRLAFL